MFSEQNNQLAINQRGSSQGEKQKADFTFSPSPSLLDKSDYPL
ncbi:hypothetical protein RintRC_0747 [Richelia intracellularis]|nr:hypothetical protein RintRC_0747 [Richelia intracellularis]